jgi:hypothetical protein
MQTVLNILVILSLAVQNVFAVLRPAAIDAKPQGNAKAASVLPKGIKDQITDPATDVPAPVSGPQDAETPTSTPEAKETAGAGDGQPDRRRKWLWGKSSLYV